MTFWIWVLLAHGVSWKPLPHARVFQVFYDNGTPMAYALVEAQLKDSQKTLEFEADSLGRIFFVPPDSGTWILKVSDGLGHGVVIPVQTSGVPSRAPNTLPPWQKALFGASLIWGIAGTAFYFLGRRRRAYS